MLLAESFEGDFCDEHDRHTTCGQQGTERGGKPALALIAPDDGASARRECSERSAGTVGDADADRAVARPAAALAAGAGYCRGRDSGGRPGRILLHAAEV